MPQDFQLFRGLIAEFDGKSPTVLTEAAVRFRSRPGYHSWLPDLARDPSEAVSSGATWLIKHELEEGWRPTEEWVLSLAGALSGVRVWNASLHICQSVRRLPLPPGSRPAFHAWIVPLLKHQRPFLRAWALDALCCLAQADGAYGPDARAALQQSLDDQAASVQARARALNREHPRPIG